MYVVQDERPGKDRIYTSARTHTDYSLASIYANNGSLHWRHTWKRKGMDKLSLVYDHDASLATFVHRQSILDMWNMDGSRRWSQEWTDERILGVYFTKVDVNGDGVGEVVVMGYAKGPLKMYVFCTRQGKMLWSATSDVDASQFISAYDDQEKIVIYLEGVQSISVDLRQGTVQDHDSPILQGTCSTPYEAPWIACVRHGKTRVFSMKTHALVDVEGTWIPWEEEVWSASTHPKVQDMYVQANRVLHVDVREDHAHLSTAQHGSELSPLCRVALSPKVGVARAWQLPSAWVLWLSNGTLVMGNALHPVAWTRMEHLAHPRYAALVPSEGEDAPTLVLVTRRRQWMALSTQDWQVYWSIPILPALDMQCVDEICSLFACNDTHWILHTVDASTGVLQPPFALAKAASTFETLLSMRAKSILDCPTVWQTRLQETTLEGWMGACAPLEKMWSLDLPGPVVARATAEQGEHVHAHATVWPDRSISMKYINPNLEVFVVRYRGLSLYVVDRVAGSVVKMEHLDAGSEPVHVVLSENRLLFAYWNKVLEQTVLEVTDLLERKVRWTTVIHSSYNRSFPVTNAGAFVWTLEAPISAIGVTQTKHGITTKEYVMATFSQSLVRLPWKRMHPQATTLETFHPHVEVPLTHHASKWARLPLVEHVLSCKTHLESSTVIVTTGLDLHATMVRPSGSFDTLPDHFSVSVLMMAMTGLLVATFCSQKFVQDKELHEKWE